MALVAALGHPIDVWAARHGEVLASPIYLDFDVLGQGETLKFHTAPASQGGLVDPVMYLLREEPSGGYTQVAVHDDNGGGDLHATIVYTHNGPVANFMLVIRAFTGTPGLVDVYRNDILRQASVPVAGTFQSLANWTWGPDDEARTSHLPGGSVAPMLLRMAGSYTIVDVAMGNGPAGASFATLAATDQSLLIATPGVRLPTEFLPLRDGTATLYLNDIMTDSDGDGVGSALEFELQLCPKFGPCTLNAGETHDGRDTDRDGLPDGEELFGVAGTQGDGSDDIALPRWGAKPRKKDVFVEVDHVGWLGNLPLGTNPFQWLRDNPTGQLGWLPAQTSLEGWFALAQQPFSAAPNDHVHNPDGSNGIALHFDLGVAPLNVLDEAKFGDYGGPSRRMIVEDWTISVDAPAPAMNVTLPADVTLTINGHSRTVDPVGLDARAMCAWFVLAVGDIIVDEGVPVEIKDFHCDTAPYTVTVATADLDVPFSGSVSASGSEVRLSTRGLGWSGLSDYHLAPQWRDVVRRGRIRYGVVGGLGQGGSTRDAAFAAGLNMASAFIHELGHTLAIAHHGHDEWGTSGVDCIPHYASMMSYSPAYQFAISEGGWTLNPAQTLEDQTFGPPNEYPYALHTGVPAHYDVDPPPPGLASKVDWNRDGAFGDAETGWRSFALSIPGKSCKAFSQGAQQLATLDDDIRGKPALVRLGTRLYALWVAGGSEIRYRSAELDLDAPKNCVGDAGPANPNDTTCLSWSPVATLLAAGPTGPTFDGVTARLTDDGLVVATADASTLGAMWTHIVDEPSPGTLLVQGAAQTPVWDPILGTVSPALQATTAPDLALRHDQETPHKLALFYLQRSEGAGVPRYIRAYGWNGSAWIHEGALLDSAFARIESGYPPAVLSWPDGRPTWDAAQRRTVGVFAEPDGTPRVYVLEQSTGRWKHLTTFFSGVTHDPTAGRPFLGYRPVRESDGSQQDNALGHFLIGWLPSDPGDGLRAFMHVSTPVSQTLPPDHPSTPMAGGALHNFLQNSWATQVPGTTLALYSDDEVDNVFGLTALTLPGNHLDGLVFYPNADGSPNWEMTTYSDFRVMEDGVCEGLMNLAPWLDCGIPVSSEVVKPHMD